MTRTMSTLVLAALLAVSPAADSLQDAPAKGVTPAHKAGASRVHLKSWRRSENWT